MHTDTGHRTPAETGRRHALWDLAAKADDGIRHRLAKIEAGHAVGALTPGELEYLDTYIATLRELAGLIRGLPGYR